MENENTTIESSETSSAPSESGSFNLKAEAEKLIAESNTEGNASNSNSLDGQSKDPLKTNEQKELTPEEIMNTLSKSQEKPLDENLLSQLNALNFIHNGQPFQVKNAEEIRELVQKGRDYTQKTMAHAEEVKKFAEERTKFETEYQAKNQELSTIRNENQIVESILKKLQSHDPDSFNYFASLYTREVEEMNKVNPLLQKYDQTINQLQEQIKGIQGQKQADELGKIREGFNSEMNQVQTELGPQLKQLGLAVNWDAVKEKWTSDVSGKMSLKEALFAVHGLEMQNAYKSQLNLLAKKNKTNEAMMSRSSLSRSTNKGATIKAVRPGDYGSILKAALDEMV